MLKLAFSIVASALMVSIVALPQVHIFTDGGFGGANADLPPGDPNGCQTLGDGWENSISSLKLDSGLGCTFYATGDCTEGAGSWEFIGDNYATIPIEANDRFSSYRCLYGLEVKVTKRDVITAVM